MAHIIKFPRAAGKPPEPVQPQPLQAKALERSPLVIRIIWVIAVLLWPLLRWLMAGDCLVQLLVAIYHWHAAPWRSGGTFALHFLAYSALTYFVGAYQPKGLDLRPAAVSSSPMR